MGYFAVGGPQCSGSATSAFGSNCAPLAAVPSPPSTNPFATACLQATAHVQVGPFSIAVPVAVASWQAVYAEQSSGPGGLTITPTSP